MSVTGGSNSAKHMQSSPPRATMPPSYFAVQSNSNSKQMLMMRSENRSISPGLIPVHQDLIPGSRGESVLANHLYWI